MPEIQRQPPQATPSHTEDTAFPAAARGIVLLGVRRDAGGTEVSTDGDLHPLQFDNVGRLRVAALVAATIDITGDESDLDTVGTDLHETFAIGLPGPGGHVIGGTATNPIRTRERPGDTLGGGDVPVGAVSGIIVALNLLRGRVTVGNAGPGPLQVFNAAFGFGAGLDIPRGRARVFNGTGAIHGVSNSVGTRARFIEESV